MCRYKVCIVIMVTLLAMSVVAGCVWVREYPAVRSGYAYAVDDSIARADMTSVANDNASRGYRGEVYINLGAGEAYPGKGLDPIEELDREISRYEGDDIKLLQVYVYIGGYYNGDISDEAFSELRRFMERIRENGLKILLRFAYETGASTDGPRTGDIERHLGQIKTFMADNIDLVNTTIYAVQMGLIGLWGEGHGAHHNIDVRRVAIALDDAIPDDIPLMVRTPEMLHKITSDIAGRFGVHDDYLVGYDHEWGMMDWDDPNYPMLINRCKYTVNDAEMPWGKDDNTADIDLMGVVRQAVGYGLTSMSIAHNYKENGGSYALDKAKSEYLTRETLDREHLPYNPMLLVEDRISIYNYLKYHLGYNLVASNLEISGGKASFMLTNYGFAMPYNYTMNVYVNGDRVEGINFSEDDLNIFGQQTYTFDYSGGDISVELVNRRDASDTIKLNNDIDYINGHNMIYAS